MESQLAYALDTFYFLVAGAFVMWMAAGSRARTHTTKWSLE